MRENGYIVMSKHFMKINQVEVTVRTSSFFSLIQCGPQKVRNLFRTKNKKKVKVDYPLISRF